MASAYDRARFTNATAWVDMRERAMDTAAKRSNPGLETQTLWGYTPPAPPSPPRKDGPMFTVSEPSFASRTMVHRVYNMTPGVPTLLPGPPPRADFSGAALFLPDQQCGRLDRTE